ncbi:Lipopolysaccharide assembly protein B [subsurface metagenome]
MKVWSGEVKELEKFNKTLKDQVPDLEKELVKLVSADDENMLLIYSRRCLEVIVTDLCECELKRPRKTEPLQGIIDKLNKEEKVPSHIITSMLNLNSLSTYGAHPKEFDPEQVRPVLINLSTIIKWYLKYKNIDYKVRVEERESESPDEIFAISNKGLVIPKAHEIEEKTNILSTPQSKNKLTQFWQELKRRKVVRVVTVYAAVAFVIIELINNIVEPLQLPEWTPTLVIVLLAIGFPIIIIFFWIFDITPEGVKVTESIEVTEQKEAKPVQPSKTDLRKKTTLIKIAIPICVVAAGIVIALYWDDIIQRVDDSNSRREIAQLHVENAMSHIQLNYLDSAKMELELALKSDSTYSPAWSNMAVLNYNQDNLDMAIFHTIKALEYDQSNISGVYNLGFTLEDKELYDQAVELYSKAIELDSTFTAAYSVLGNLYNKLNRPVDAILVLNKAKRITPESVYIFLIYKNLGNAYLLLEQYDEAIKHLEHSRYLNQNYPETNLFLAKAYEASGDMNKSIEMWQVYIDLETDTLKIREAQEHLKEITIKHLQ